MISPPLALVLSLALAALPVPVTLTSPLSPRTCPVRTCAYDPVGNRDPSTWAYNAASRFTSDPSRNGRGERST